MVNEIDLLLNRIKDLQDRVRVIEASLSTGQQSYDSVTVAANYSHVHRRSSILDLTVDSDIDHDELTNFLANEHIDWTSTSENFNTSGTLKADGTIQFTAQVNFAGGTTYKVEADGDANFKELSCTGAKGIWNFDTNTGADSFYISRTGATTQALKVYMDDNNLYFHLDQDEDSEHLVIWDSINTFPDQWAYVWRIGAGDHVKISHDLVDIFKQTKIHKSAQIGDGGTTNYLQVATNGTLSMHGSATLTGNILHDGTGGDDERVRLPYLTGVPASVDNGSLWIEADGLHGYLAAAERNLSRPHCLDSYIDIKERQAVWNIHGGIISISTGNALDADPTDIDDTIGLGKIIIVINAGGDVTGEITVTGTTVDRDTGAETGADTDTITVDTLSTDNSGTDAGGNVTYAFVNAYMTTKWFKGAVTLSTTNLTLTDVDIYQCSFEQFNDLPNVTIDTIDTNQFANNAAANIYWHLYSIKPTGDKLVLALEKSMELEAADVSANLYYRLRRGNLGISIDGSTQGFFVQCYPEPLASIYWEDINLKIWYT